MALRISSLGTFEVWQEGQLIQDWKREKTKALFKILLCEPGRVFSQDELIEYLWPDLDPKSAASNLRSRVGELRHVLEPQLQKGSASKYIVTRHQGYCFQRHADDWLDVAELEYLYEAGRQAEGQGNWAKAVSLYQSAASLYRGPYLAEDPYEEWTIAPRQKWQSLYLDLLSHLAECHARLGQYRRAIARCREILRIEKYRESSYRQLMLYSYLAGYHGEALRAYQECHTALAELDARLEPATQQLYEQIIQHHIPGIDQIYQALPILHHEIPYALSPGSVPFVGREAEHARLREYLEQARAGQGGCVLLDGEAGVGKTRLAQEGLAYAYQQFKALILQGRGYEISLHTAYQPWTEIVREALTHGPSPEPNPLAPFPAREGGTPSLFRGGVGGEVRPAQPGEGLPPLWLAEVAKLVPELRARVPDLPENPPLPPDQEQLRFFEGMTQFFLSLTGTSSRSPLLLFLDNLHWIDHSSLEFLNYFLPRLKEQPILIVGTYRSEEVPEGGPLHKLIQTWVSRDLARVISLERLKVSEVERLLRSLPLRVKHPDVFCQRLYKETEGSPLFLIATLQHFFEEGALRAEGSAWVTDIEDISKNYRELMIPPTVKELIAQRVARLNESERKLLQLASVIGHDFEFALLKRVWEDNGERALERLTKAQLLIERRGRYEFSHEKIREVVYEEISPPLRQLLHQRVLCGLEQLYGGQLENWAGLLAYHAYQAGEWRKTLEYALQALKRAVKEYRHQEGLRLAELGLEAALNMETAGADSLYVIVSRFELLAQRADIYLLAGRQREQEQDLAQLEELAKRLQDRQRQAMALEKKSGLYIETGRYAGAQELARKAWALYKEIGNRRGEGVTLHNIGLVYTHLGQYEEAMDFYHQALAIFREIGEQKNAGYVLNSLATIYSLQGNYAEALGCYQQNLEISNRLGDRKAQVVGLNNIGIIHENLGQYEKALSYYQQAWELCQQIGYRQAQWACLNGIGNIYGTLKRYEEALHYHHHALEISQELQDQRGQAYSLYNIGDIHHKLEQYAEVLTCCGQAQVIFQALGAKAEELLALSMKAFAHAQLNEQENALECSSQAIQILDSGQYYEYPHEIYFNHFKILSAFNQETEALTYLQKAYDEVMRRAEQIASDAQRRSFLENVKLNREIVQAYRDRASQN